MKKLLTILIITIFIGCAGESVPSAPPTPTPTPLKVNLRDLLEMRKSNEMAADRKYIGKKVEIRGLVSTIDEKYVDIIPLDSDAFQISGARCNVIQRQRNDLYEIAMNQPIKIIGKIDSINDFLVTIVEVDDCKFEYSKNFNSSDESENSFSDDLEEAFEELGEAFEELGEIFDEDFDLDNEMIYEDVEELIETDEMMIEYDSTGYNGCDGLERLMDEDHIVYVSSEYYILTSSPYDLDKQCQQVINRLFEVGTAETALNYPNYFAVLVPRNDDNFQSKENNQINENNTPTSSFDSKPETGQIFSAESFSNQFVKLDLIGCDQNLLRYWERMAVELNTIEVEAGGGTKVLPDKSEAGILLVGGNGQSIGGHSKKVEHLNPNTGICTPLPDMKEPSYGGKLIVDELNDIVVLFPDKIGGKGSVLIMPSCDIMPIRCGFNNFSNESIEGRWTDNQNTIYRGYGSAVLMTPDGLLVSGGSSTEVWDEEGDTKIKKTAQNTFNFYHNCCSGSDSFSSLRSYALNAWNNQAGNHSVDRYPWVNFDWTKHLPSSSNKYHERVNHFAVQVPVPLPSNNKLLSHGINEVYQVVIIGGGNKESSKVIEVLGVTGKKQKPKLGSDYSAQFSLPVGISGGDGSDDVFQFTDGKVAIMNSDENLTIFTIDHNSIPHDYNGGCNMEGVCEFETIQFPVNSKIKDVSGLAVTENIFLIYGRQGSSIRPSLLDIRYPNSPAFDVGAPSWFEGWYDGTVIKLNDGRILFMGGGQDEAWVYYPPNQSDIASLELYFKSEQREDGIVLDDFSDNESAPIKPNEAKVSIFEDLEELSQFKVTINDGMPNELTKIGKPEYLKFKTMSFSQPYCISEIDGYGDSELKTYFSGDDETWLALMEKYEGKFKFVYELVWKGANNNVTKEIELFRRNDQPGYSNFSPGVTLDFEGKTSEDNLDLKKYSEIEKNDCFLMSEVSSELLAKGYIRINAIEKNIDPLANPEKKILIQDIKFIEITIQ